MQGVDLPWPNPNRPMFFHISTGNEEMVCMNVCMYVCHIFMQEDNICMYSVLLCKQLCVCMYDTLYVYVCMYVCMRSVQGAGGTSFLNRTEAAAVEKLVTLMLKAGSIFMSIHTYIHTYIHSFIQECI